MKIGAVIVTYNPDVDILKNTIKFLEEKEIFTVIVDNDSKNISEFFSLKKVSLIQEESNVGIAKALNDGVKFLLKNTQCDWVLTLDQDSIMSSDYFDEIPLLNPTTNIAVYVPFVIERNVPENIQKKMKEKDAQSREGKFNQMPIQSGAIIRIKDYVDVGGMDESLFIDGVDLDFYLEITRQKKKIVQLSKAVLYQSMGEKEEKNFLSFKYYVDNYSPMRNYYRFRNIPIIIKRHKDVISLTSLEPTFLKYIWRKLLKTILGENNKIKKIHQMFRGYRDRKKLNIIRKRYM